MATSGDELAPHILHDVQGLEEGNKKVEELGSGAYGFVFKVTVGGLPCMAKKLHDVFIKGLSANERNHMQKKFREECILLSKLNHPNIVHFVGVCYGKSKQDLILVMERLRTDVATFVKDHPNVPISIKVSTLLDVSYGLAYLHGQTPPIVHRDLTAPNVLLTNDCRGKIADLGVSKVLRNPRMIKHTTAPGNAYYMAPETKVENPQYDTSIDVFSLGHLAIHISIQDWPETYRVDHHLVQPGKVEIGERKKVLERMGKEHPLYPLTIQCLQDDPKRRPSTAGLNEMLIKLSTRHPKTAKDLIPLLKEPPADSVQLTRSERDFQAALKTKDEEMKRTIAELTQEFEDEAYLVAAEKLSLEEEHEKLTKEFKLKEKHLEIMATEKALVLEELNHERKALEDEMRHTRATNAAFAVEIKEDREKLETTIADTCRLHDEVLAKTQQVKQYKKQVDSYKAKLDEANNKLQVAQRDHQEQVKALEEDHQKLIELGMAKMKSEKLEAENDLRQSQRMVATLQVELKQWQERKMSEGQVSEALRGEIRKKEEAEQKFEASMVKYKSLYLDDQEVFDPQQQGGPPPPFIPSSNVSPSNARATQGGANTAHPGYVNVNIREESSHGGNQSSHGGSNASPRIEPTDKDYENQETLERFLAEEQQGSPYNQGYQQGNQGYNQDPQTYPPKVQYSHPPTNQGYHQNQQYTQGNFQNQQYQLSKKLHPQSRQSSADYQQQNYPPTSQAYNISHQGYDQTQGGYYDPHMQRQAGIGGVNPDQQAFRPRGGSHGAYSAQGPSPQGQYGGGVPPGGHNFEQTQPPVPAPRKKVHAEKDQSPPAPRVEQDSTVQENVLLQDVDTDIALAAAFVKLEIKKVESLREAPLDPNLVCPLCMRGFRIGEIQKYRKHVNTCQGQ